MDEKFEQADLELVKGMKACRFLGKTDTLPENPISGDIYMYPPIGHPIIFMDKWYMLPNPEVPQTHEEDEKDEKERNETVDSLFTILDWPMLPKGFYKPIEKAIDMLEADREIVVRLNTEIINLTQENARLRADKKED